MVQDAATLRKQWAEDVIQALVEEGATGKRVFALIREYGEAKVTRRIGTEANGPKLAGGATAAIYCAECARAIGALLPTVRREDWCWLLVDGTPVPVCRDCYEAAT